VASRSLWQPADEPRTSLSRVALLTLANRPDAWEQWAAQAGVPLDRRRPVARYDRFAMLAQAASAGAGAALIPDYLIDAELEDGRLVEISPCALVNDGAYYLVYPDDKLEKSAFRKFRDWLLAEVRRSDGDL
jgi:LysR family glycine cleavage system transcriptional activator